MQLVLLSGLSGSGKSIALNVLEDAGYYTVDNLPASLIDALITTLQKAGYTRAAVAVDMRSRESVAVLPEVLERVRNRLEDVRFIFLDARNETLMARFSETRRRHPLADDGVTVEEAISHEREALEAVAALGHHMDTSDIPPNGLRQWIKDFIGMPPHAGLTLMFESFGFKYGIPLDADFVFDVRCLPNPYYDQKLRHLTGEDDPVIAFLSAIPSVQEMGNDIAAFVEKWLPAFQKDNRSYLTVGIGCTGGQHRSVYLATLLGRYFEKTTRVLVRHRSAARR